jgi:glucose-1-phosphate thymidylyltransferase
VNLGDNILCKGIVEYTKKFKLSNADAMILLCEVSDPSRFGMPEFDANKIKNF